MQFFRRLIERFKAWRSRSAPVSVAPTSPFRFSSHMATIHREVTPQGVRVYSLCGCCGTALPASATLCEECAQKRSKPARPY